MSGRRWILILLAAIPVSATGCQVDGGTTKMWNPFARADKTDVMEEGQLPKFVRRATEEDPEKSKTTEDPIARSRVTTRLAEGQRALQDNRITDARQAYNEVLQLVPDDPTAHHGLAMAADLMEQWAEAEVHYRQALRSRPRDANLLCDIGYSYLLQNRYSEASSYLSQAIQINPNLENAHTNLALLDVRQGNREAARERLIQRHGNSAKVAQILAALEKQTAAGAATGLAATAPAVPENASFEQIREIASRERIAAEHRRAALHVPADQDAAIRPVRSAGHTNVPGQNVPGQDDTADLQGTGQQSNRFAGAGVNPAAAGTQSAENYRTGNIPRESDAPGTGAVMPYTVPPQSGVTSDMASRTNLLGSIPNANLQYSTNQGPAGFSSQQSSGVDNAAPQTANTVAASGDVIAVRPSGSFQPPTQGASYGQPFGFSQPPIESASPIINPMAAAPVGNVSYGTAAYGNIAGPPAASVPGQQHPDAVQQYPHAGQHRAHIQLDGLNAGPGSLFPIGQGSGALAGQLDMGNVSAPGSDSAINGAMYGQPVSTLPAQEWMMQQQQQIQKLNSQPQQLNQNGQRFSDHGHTSPRFSGNILPGPQSGMSQGNTGTTGSTTAPRPGNQAQPVSPLASYENQLRQLDNQYNNTLEQLDRNATPAVPRARY